MSLAVFPATAADWPQYRGPNHDGVSTDRINRQWSGSVTNPLWLVSLTNGVCSLTVSGGRAFTQAFQTNNGLEMEICLALNSTNGTPLWQTTVETMPDHNFGEPDLYPNVGVGFTDDGPRTTPTADGGSVYVLSSYLKLLRLNATNGAVVWSNDLRIAYGGDVIPWQNAASPLIENGLIYVNAHCATNTLLALRTSDGALAWRSQNEGMTHSTPVLATIHGVRQVIFATQSGLVSLNPQTGSLLWRFNYPFTYDLSLAASPAVLEDMVFITGYYSMGAAVMRVIPTNGTFVTTQLWSNASLQSHWSTPVCYQGCLFGQFTPDSADAQLRCINLTNGTLNWAVNGFGRGSVLLVDDHLLAITERGQLVLARPNTNAYTEVARFQAIPNYNSGRNKCWNALAVSDGKVYIRSTAYATAFDFSVPNLKLDPPKSESTNKFQLTIRTIDGTPVNSNRIAAMELRASTNIALSPSLWSKLTNVLTLTNGVVRVTNVDAGAPRRFFIVSEPE